MINREFIHILEKKLHKGKIILLVGPRQVGKTTLINELLKDKEFLFLNGDDASVVELISQANTEILRSVIGNYKFVFIDEAQRIPHIGLKLKIIADQMKGVQVLVSGSSALDINNMTQEPLTGRKFEYHLFPISWKEFQDSVGYLKAQQQLEIRLLYGMYPDVINHFGEEKEILENLVSSYLYKDILALANIRKPEILEKILRALAFQVGSEVSFNEIAQLIGVDKNTVSHYIDLLEKCFVIFPLHSFSRNLRNEIKSNRKIYFYDNGVRNMILGDFTPFALRQDKGALWENFMISERKKRLNFQQSLARPYFWRTTAQQEVDYLEVTANDIRAFEFKWSDTKKAKLPKPFSDNYTTELEVINKTNFRDFVSEEIF